MVERSGVVAVVDGFRWNHYPVRQVAQITQVEYVSHRAVHAGLLYDDPTGMRV